MPLGEGVAVWGALLVHGRAPFSLMAGQVCVLFGGATFLWVLFAADCCKHTEGVVDGQRWLWLAFLWFGLSRFLDSLEKASQEKSEGSLLSFLLLFVSWRSARSLIVPGVFLSTSAGGVAWIVVWECALGLLG